MSIKKKEIGSKNKSRKKKQKKKKEDIKVGGNTNNLKNKKF